MKGKRDIISMIVIIPIIILIFVGYNIYRHPAMFRNLSDQSLNKEAINDLRAGLLGKL